MKLMKITCFAAFYLVLISVFIGCEKKNQYPSLTDKKNYLFEEIQSKGTLSNSKAFTKEIQDSLEVFLDSMLNYIKLSSVSVAIGIPDVGVWTAVRLNDAHAYNIDTKSVYHAESTGKIYTSVVILKLVEQGVLSLESTIDKWYSYIPKSDKITIRDLLMHTSGIPSFESCKEYNYAKVYKPIEKVLWSVKYPYLFEPGTSFSYSNTGYILLGLIAEQASGKSFEELLKQNIITPLGLKHTYAITLENKDTLITQKGYKGGKEIILMEDITGPSFSGCIASTPRDQIIFLQALMSGSILSKESVEDMFYEMNRFTDIVSPVYYGKGIMAMPNIPSNQFPYDLLIEHNGGSTWMGYYSYPLYVPEINMFVSVMTNDYVQYSESIKYNLAAYLIKLL